MQAAAERVQQQCQCSLSLGDAALQATLLSCYELASESSAATALIPAVLLRWLEATCRAGSAGAAHRILGHGAALPAAARERAHDVLLLQIAGDAGLPWLNSVDCALQFWIAPQTLAARDFNRVTLVLQCARSAAASGS